MDENRDESTNDDLTSALANLSAEAQQRLEALLIEGLESGPATPMTRKDWDDIRAKVKQHRESRRHG